MIRKYIGVVVLIMASAGTAHPQEPAFEVLRVTEAIKLQEHIDEANGTMSGALRPTIRTNELFSAFQLINRSKNVEIKMEHLRNAPITVPAALSGEDLRLCAEVRTINGFYSAVGASGALAKLDTGDQSVLGSLVEANESHMIDSSYTEELMLMRSFVASDCVAAQTQYYVPLYFSEDANAPAADTFLAVFEIGNAAVEADLYGVTSAGITTENKLISLECGETTRVDIGFDCMFDLTQVERAEYALFELRISITQPHRSKPLKPVLRISLPNAN